MMTEPSDTKNALKTLQARAARDAQLLKLLDEIDRVAALADRAAPDPATQNSLASLPYSSDPPQRGEKWVTA